MIFVDDKKTIYDFMDIILVNCPNCHNCAKLIKSPSPRRFICTECGTTKSIEKEIIHKKLNLQFINEFYGYSLWLSTNCAGEKLWAYNKDHLEWLENYIKAKFRLHGSYSIGEIRNQTLFSKMPHWMIVAKNREKILYSIKKLKQKLE